MERGGPIRQDCLVILRRFLEITHGLENEIARLSVSQEVLIISIEGFRLEMNKHEFFHTFDLILKEGFCFTFSLPDLWTALGALAGNKAFFVRSTKVGKGC